MGGHPDLDVDMPNIFLACQDNVIHILTGLDNDSPMVKKASIPIELVSDISVEDATTFEKRVSLGRVMLVGIFALAWQKRK